jgi:PPK2 family polyphosphate:nucleotide phosphotransferase
MPLKSEVLDTLRVDPGEPAKLPKRSTRDTLGLAGKTETKEWLDEHGTELATLQGRLWAERTRAVLVVLQGMDSSGKDGTIKHVMSGLNPSAVRIAAFGAPSSRERSHDYLWRVHVVCPPRGYIGVFNRSHYEDIVTAPVEKLVDARTAKKRISHINDFERMLVDEGTSILKVFLHISRDEQAERLRTRILDPEKSWKFDRSDLDTRSRWDAYSAAYEKAITATSTSHAPWYVVPADRKWVRNAAVAGLLHRELVRLDPKTPAPRPELAKLQGILGI